MLKLQVVLVPPSALKRDQRLIPQGTGYPNQTLNSSPNLFNRGGLVSSTPNTNNNHHASNNFQNSSFMPMEPAPLRKFLHITQRSKTLLEIAHEITLRFEKLYPDEDSLEILKLQDSQECDLDPDYRASDVFDYDRVVRVLLSNEIASDEPVPNNSDISQITNNNGKRAASPVYSSIILPKKRRAENRETVWRNEKENEIKRSTPLANQIYPYQQDDADEEKQGDQTKDGNVSLRNISINAEDSAELSLPPPDADETRYLDPKKTKAPVATSPLPPSSKRITSGMLVAPEPQLKEVEDKVLEEKQINEEITQRIIPVKRSLEDKTAENISLKASKEVGDEEDTEDTDTEDEEVLKKDILPEPSQIKKYPPPLEADSTTTLPKPKEEPKPKSQPNKANKPVEEPKTAASNTSTLLNKKKDSSSSSGRASKEPTPEFNGSQNTSASEIIANVTSRGNVTNKESFSDSDEDGTADEPEFTKDEIIKIFRSGRLPASVTKKFQKHNSQKPVPPKTVRAAALKAAERMSIPITGNTLSSASTPALTSREETEESDDEKSSDSEESEDEEDEDEETEEESEPEKQIKSRRVVKKPAATTTSATGSGSAPSPAVPAPKAKAPEVPSATQAKKVPEVKAAAQVKKAPEPKAPEPKKSPASSQNVEPKVAVAATQKVTEIKKTDVDGDVEMGDAAPQAEKLESLSQSLKELDAQSTQLKDIEHIIKDKATLTAVKKPESAKIDAKLDAAVTPAKKPIQPAKQMKTILVKPGGTRINVDELPQEFPTEEVPGLAEVLAQFKKPNLSDLEFNELLKERRRLLYNAKRRYLRKVKNSSVVSESDISKSQLTPSQAAKKPIVSSSINSTKPADSMLSQDSIEIDPDLTAHDITISDEAANETRRIYEKAKQDLELQKQQYLTAARKQYSDNRSKKLKERFHDARSSQIKSDEIVNDSSSGSGSSGSESDSDSDSDDDDEEEDDKTKKPPRIVNTPKGLSQPLPNLRKTIAENKKLPDVKEIASAPVTPSGKKAPQETPSKAPAQDSSKASQPVKKPNNRYSLSSLSDLVSRGVPDVLDSLTPKGLRTQDPTPAKKKESESEASDDDDDDDDDDSTDDSDSDDSSSDEELKGSQRYLSAKTAKGLVGSQKGKKRTSSAFKGLLKDALKK